MRLGFWQLQRADLARALQAAVAAQATAAPLDLTLAADTASIPAWRRVSARGTWDARHQLLLDNQVVAGQVGYLVFTPLAIEGCACAVLVNRGWIPLGKDRQAVPALALPPGLVDIGGIAAPPPPAGVGVRANLADVLAPGVLRVQRIDPAGVAKWLGTQVLPLTVRLDAAAPDGYLRNWTPPPDRADRHTAYATQWFLLASIVMILLLALNLRRPGESNRSPP